MKQNIEKFLLWACICKLLAVVIPMVYPILLQNLIVNRDVNSSFLISVSSWIYILSTLPLRLVCGLWLKNETEALQINQRIWFWFGFLFEFIGILVFYAYLTFCKKQNVQ